MADSENDLIIVRDRDGAFYAFTPEQWAEAQVPDDVQAALAEVFDGDDTQGLNFSGLSMVHLQGLVDSQQVGLPLASRILANQHEMKRSLIANFPR